MKKAFVASWFFPPSTTAEAIVAWKLLHRSTFAYDVSSSVSGKWTYKTPLPLTSPNITQLPLATEEFQPWVDYSVRLFLEKSAEQPYDFFMTRSMPPESHQVGLTIKRATPKMFWVATFGDPVANNPYELNAMFHGSKYQRHLVNLAARFPGISIPVLGRLGKGAFYSHLLRLQQLAAAIHSAADLLVFPTIEQCRYSLGRNLGRYRHKCAIIPHSFEPSLYPAEKAAPNARKVMAFIGYADLLRNPLPLLEHLCALRRERPALTDQMEFRLIGNIPDHVRTYVAEEKMEAFVSVSPSVDYLTSLAIMRKADCLVHIDAFFDFLEHKTIFLASKIADYIGSGTPILGLTSPASPAAKLIREYGGTVAAPEDQRAVLVFLENFLAGRLRPTAHMERYTATSVAATFDRLVLERHGNVDELH